MLKKSIASHQRSQQQLLKGSDHTKNQLMKANQDKLSLQNEVVQLRSTLRMAEGDLATGKERLFNLERQYKKLEQQFNMATLKASQAQEGLNKLLIQRDHLANQNHLLASHNRNLEFELQKLLADNQKQELLNQVNVLTTKLRDSEHHLSKSKKLEEQKSNELLAALGELAEVKRLLT